MINVISGCIYFLVQCLRFYLDCFMSSFMQITRCTFICYSYKLVINDVILPLLFLLSLWKVENIKGIYLLEVYAEYHNNISALILYKNTNGITLEEKFLYKEYTVLHVCLFLNV